MRQNHILSISILSILFVFTGCNLNPATTTSVKPVSMQKTTRAELTQRQREIQMNDTTRISQDESFLIFRGIFEDGLQYGFLFCQADYNYFQKLIHASGLKWNEYLNGVFLDGVASVDLMSTWKMIYTVGDVYKNVYFDLTEVTPPLPLGFLYYVAGVDEGIRSAGAGQSAKDSSLTHLFIFGAGLRESYDSKMDSLTLR